MSNKKNKVTTTEKPVMKLEEVKTSAPIVIEEAVAPKPKKKRYHKPKVKLELAKEVVVEVIKTPTKKLTWFERTFPKLTIWLNK